MSLLEELLIDWNYVRDGVIAEVENLPASKLKQPPRGLPRTGLDLANHIVEVARMMVGELTRDGGDFRRRGYFELIAEYAQKGDVGHSKKEVVELLKRSHDEGEAAFRKAGQERMAQPIRQFNGVYASRLSWFHHGIAHEEYHRGQLAIYARLYGDKPALTKLIEGG
jgi:uncharacterized damage-inducible protein DinB